MATCNIAALLADGKCYACLTPVEREMVKLQLWCDIASASGGGPAPITDPTDIPGIVFWLDGTTLTGTQGDPIFSWADSSGNGNHFTDDGGFYAAPTVDYLEFPAGCAQINAQTLICNNALTAQPLSIFMVQSVGLAIPGTDAIYGLGGAVGTATWYQSSAHDNHQSYFTGGVDAFSDTPQDWVNGKLTWGMSVSPGNPPKFYRHGVTGPNLSNLNNGDGFDADRPLLCAYPTGAPSIFGQGYVAEMVYYNRELNATEVGQLQTYFVAKWGL